MTRLRRALFPWGPIIAGGGLMNEALIQGAHVNFGWWGWMFWGGLGMWLGVLIGYLDSR